MRRYQLHRHLKNAPGRIDAAHPFSEIDLSETEAGVITVSVETGSDLLVECGPRPVNLFLLLKEGVDLKLQVIGPQASLDWTMNLALAEGATAEVTMADFGSFSGHVVINGELHGRTSRIEWHLASLSRQSEEKKYSVNFRHTAPESYANMTNYGVVEDTGKLTFTGVSHIHKGARQSATHQTARILVFDPRCVGRADPVLAIDDNEVAASHAATVGRINEEHMFYLKSRGIDETAARRLITYGYLKPAIDRFHDEGAKQRLLALLESRL
jgi:Fe-S cluster assembly scaffold protein SufB